MVREGYDEGVAIEKWLSHKERPIIRPKHNR